MSAQPNTSNRILLVPVILATFGCHAAGTAQSTPQAVAEQAQSDQFDLVVYGFDLDADEHELLLRSNLDFGSEWVSLGVLRPAWPAGDAGGVWSVAIFPGLSTARFLGQDFRENYLDLRIVTREDSDGSGVSAFYATPHSPDARNAAAQILRLIEIDPLVVEQHSLASHVQPKPHLLQPGTEYVEHVRAPMTHTLPGVAEVKQLEVEWRNRGH